MYPDTLNVSSGLFAGFPRHDSCVMCDRSCARRAKTSRLWVNPISADPICMLAMLKESVSGYHLFLTSLVHHSSYESVFALPLFCLSK